MRLAKRRLAFLLSCSLMFNSSHAQAGLMAQELVDRLEFIEYAGLALSVFVSKVLKSYILGNGPKPDSPAELEDIDRLWDEHQVEFAISQTTFFVQIRVCANGVEFKLKPEELQKISEIAPGLSAIIAASYHHEVHLPISRTMLRLLVKIVKGENTDDTVLDLLNGEREELEQLVEEVENFNARKSSNSSRKQRKHCGRKSVRLHPDLRLPWNLVVQKSTRWSVK